MPLSKLHKQKEEFEHLFSLNYHSLFYIGVSLCGEREWVKDMLQSFFLELWEKKIWEREIEHIPAYLKKGFYRKVIYELKQRRKHQFQSLEDSPQSSIPSYEDTMIMLEDHQAISQKLNEALEQLPSAQREMINLRFKKGMAYDEIASATGKSPQTIYNQVYTAIKKVRTLLLPSTS